MEIFVYIDMDTYKELKYNTYDYPNFLEVCHYPRIDDAKTREVGRIKNIRFLMKTDVNDLIYYLKHEIYQICSECNDNVLILKSCKDILNYFRIVQGKDEK